VLCGKGEVRRWLEAFPRALTNGEWRCKLEVATSEFRVYGVQYAKKAMKPSNF